LIQIVDRIVHDDIDPVAQLIVEQVGYGLYIILSCFDRVFSYVLTARIKVGNEMVRLIILPVDVLVLYTILTKFYFGRLSRKIGGKQRLPKEKALIPTLGQIQTNLIGGRRWQPLGLKKGQMKSLQ
jgi:hypothetical protein